MQQVLLIVQILVALGVIVLVLLQQGRGADAGAAFGSGSAGSVFGARGPSTLLTRGTAILATVFFLNSMLLAYMAKERSLETRSVMERVDVTVPAPSTVPSTDDVPSGGMSLGGSDVPVVPSGGSDGPSKDASTDTSKDN